MSNKMVENSCNIGDVVESTETKDKSLLLLTVREGSAALPVFLRRLSEDGKVVIGLEQVARVGFRKIEPKPVNEIQELKEDTSCDPQTVNNGDTRSPSLLESKSTRRGVRICPSCQGRVGYRSKVCKHCSISSGVSSRSSPVRRKQSRQQKQKLNTKRNARAVSVETRNVEENTDECHSALSSDNFDVQIRCEKSAESVLYVPETTVGNQFSATSEYSMATNVDGNQGNILYQTQHEISDVDENTFDKEQMMEDGEVCSLKRVNKRSYNKSSQNLVHEKFTTRTRNSDCNLPNMKSTQLLQESDEIVAGNSEELSSEDLEQNANNLGSDAGHYISDDLHNDAKNTAPDVEDLTDDTTVSNLDSSKDNGEDLATTNAEDIPCIADEEVQNEDEMSASTSEGVISVAPQNEESGSPILLVHVNSIGSISVTTSDDNSQTADQKEYSVSTESAASENTFVFESTDTNSTTAVRRSEDIVEGPVSIFRESNVGSEKYQNIKRNQKRKVGQDAHHRRKQHKLSIVQFVRIEPKPFLEINEDSSSRKNNEGALKQNRLLSSNPTRRGVMLCPLCQKDVGCRSKTCKYCKVAINLCPTKLPLEQKNLLAVQLCKETCPHYTIYSVKKSFNASEERCFVKKVAFKEEEELSKNEVMISDVFSCDCSEYNPAENSTCEHILSMHRSPKITPARKMTLKPSKIDSLPIDFVFKLKLGEFWETIKEKEFPFVQQVCQNTLVVSDVDSDVSATQNSVHVRFEKLRRRSTTELHIFCSGKTCSGWNEVEEEGKDVPVTCLHYCVSLWAIASDNDLQKYFKIFLDATQVYLHSEVFESILKE